MPRSSRASLSEETIKELEDQFYTFIDSLSSDERRKFFGEFLTVEEKMMMYKRLALYWCLLEGYSLAKIQQMIGVTHDTTRVYNKKKNTLSSEFKELVQRIAKNEAIEEASVKPVEEEQKSEEPTMQEEVKEETETTADDMLQMEEVKEPENTEEEHIETSEEKHEEAHVEPETETKEESMDQKPMDDSENNIWAVEHKEEENMEETKSEETQSTDTSESSDEEKKEEDGGEKKKGWGKFFGF